MDTLLSAFRILGSWTTLDLLNHLWQSTAAGLAVLLLLTICAPLSARTRRALGLMALAKFALPMAAVSALMTRFGGTTEGWLESPALTLPVNLPPGVIAAASSVSPPNVSSPAHLPLGAMLTVAWFAGFAVLIAWWLVRGLRVRRRILASATSATTAIEQGAARAAARVGLRNVPHCATVEDTHDAGVLGVFSPVVVLPRGLEDTLTPAELEAVLIHEFVHVTRRDNLWGAVQYFLASLFWFHPLVWLLNRRIGLEAEKACDERVLEITGDPEAYAAGIMKCVRHALGVAQPGLAGVTTPPVVARMQNILKHGTRRDRPLARGAVLVAGVTLLVLSGQAGSFAISALAVPSAQARVTTVAADAAAPGGTEQVLRSGVDEAALTRIQRSLKGKTTLSVEFDDENVQKALAQVAEVFELKIRWVDTLKARTTVRLREATWRQIFKSVLDPVGFDYIEASNFIIIGLRDNLPANRGTSRADSGTTVVAAPSQSATPAPVAVPAEPTLSVDFPDEDIRSILRNVADLFQLNIIMPQTLQGKTTLKLNDVTWRQIFQQVLEPVGYTFVEDRNIIKIVTKESQVDELVATEIFQIKNAKAADFAPTIGSLVDPAKGKIQVDARTNTLVITERPSRLNRIRTVIEQLDRSTSTVRANAAVDFLVQQANRLKRQADEAQQRLDTHKVANVGGAAGEVERKALERQAQATANNLAAVEERLRLTQQSAIVTAESARLLAIAAERDAEVKRTRAEEDAARRERSLSAIEGAPREAAGAQAPTAPSSSLQPLTPPRLTPSELAQEVGRPAAGSGPLRGMQVFDISKLDQTPVPKYQARPLYPREMREQGIVGEVLVDFIIDTNGDVQNAYAAKSSRVEFEASAVQAVSKWRFKPGRKGGRDVHTHMQVPIVFALNEK